MCVRVYGKNIDDVDDEQASHSNQTLWQNCTVKIIWTDKKVLRKKSEKVQKSREKNMVVSRELLYDVDYAPFNDDDNNNNDNYTTNNQINFRIQISVLCLNF